MKQTVNKSRKLRLSGKMKNYHNVLLTLAVAGLVTLVVFSFSMPRTTTGGSISVTVKYQGTVPNISPFKITKDQRICSHEIQNETLHVGSGNEIKNTMIYIKGAPGTISPQDYVLDNQSCKFIPHVELNPARRDNLTR